MAKTCYGFKLNSGGPGVNESVRETFHEREIFPDSTGQMVMAPDIHASGFASGAAQTVNGGNHTYAWTRCNDGVPGWADGYVFSTNMNDEMDDYAAGT